ncbi:hypothetical protein FHU38_001155 [Saccharomonospora amisosensis]|uniref:HNH nuclease domain-containing protein n=1 Tax=Saccharomonospora amisosensis TaxID=1128677 RepID=A0A7X5ZPT6_9PSEU|nr:hypothetical protein [Saccharomonospora amisosensis]
MTRTFALDEASSLARLGDEEVVAALRRLEIESRRLYAARLRLIAEIDARGLAGPLGYSGAAALVREVGGHNPGAARKLVAQARALNSSVTRTGAVVEAELPRTAEALWDGSIGPEHVEAIRAAVEILPRKVSPDDRQSAEAILVEAAQASEPRIVTRLGREIRARLDPDGEPPEEGYGAGSGPWLALRPRPDGGLTGVFGLDAESGALLTNLLSPLTAPRVEGGAVDSRSRDERYGDALVDVLRLAARSPRAPDEAGEPVTVLVTADLIDLERRAGPGLLDGHLSLSSARIRRLACDASVVPAVFGGRGEILDVGRASRTVPRAIRRALILRDAGCTFPGCDRKAKWCQAHHIVHWADGGPTALDNLALVCAYHHRLLHRTDWTVTMIDGRPWYRPPGYVDPDRVPRRNVLHAHRVGSVVTTRQSTVASCHETDDGTLPPVSTNSRSAARKVSSGTPLPAGKALSDRSVSAGDAGSPTLYASSSSPAYSK